MNDNNQVEISRGRSQILFNYMPESMADISGNKNAIIKVTKFSGKKLENVNESRIIKTVKKELDSFIRKKDYPQNININSFVILEPEKIEAELFPLSFSCNKCNTFYSFEKISNIPVNMKCNISSCTGKLKQISFVFACEGCGFLGQLKANALTRKDTNMSYDEMKFDLTFHLEGSRRHIWYSKKLGKKVEIKIICPECKSNTILSPDSYKKTGIYNSKVINIIDLVENEIEKNIDKAEVSKAIVADYLGFNSSRLDIKRLIKDAVLEPETPEDYNYRLQEEIQDYIEEEGLSQEEAERKAKKKLDTRSPKGKLDKIIKLMEEKNIFLNDFNWEELALRIFEYETILNGEIKTIEDAQNYASQLSSSASPEKFLPTKNKYKFERIIASSLIPMLTISYGYNRKQLGKRNLVIAFPFDEMYKNTAKRPIYSTKHNTEGVLFDLDKRSIIEWLLKSGVDSKLFNIDENKLDDKTYLKSWFVSNINVSKINSFEKIDSNDIITSLVYNLIHSISHCLISSASELCGLEKNSLSEYLFPQLGSFLIYCHNSSQSNLGALFNLFQAHIDKWLELAFEKSRTCLNDPICIDNYNASCFACMHLNEICCQHFNHDLCRSYLSGNINKDTNQVIFGFWE